MSATPPARLLGTSVFATLESIADMETLPVDGEAARPWARLCIHLAETGRRVRINDLWVAAVAASRTLPVVT
jgi:predicted nucleic acid-binding protein